MKCPKCRCGDLDKLFNCNKCGYSLTLKEVLFQKIKNTIDNILNNLILILLFAVIIFMICCIR